MFVFFEASDAQAIYDALVASNDPIAKSALLNGFAAWTNSPFGESPNTDLNTAVPGRSRRIEVRGVTRKQFAKFLMAQGGYLHTLGLDVMENGEG